MNFKKSKSEIVSEAQARALSTLNGSLSSIKYSNVGNMNFGTLIDQISNATGYAIGEAIRHVLENTYTDEEFEQDLQLREKK